ncbi:hypothetical protein ACIBCA_36225 [Kitasatospora sp. NPDC051170]|uniref:hypothetical protein n=1 Tax=Kitasatospora sp. NPDC051170 TaxID=3364056 RepID=UPI0037AFF012
MIAMRDGRIAAQGPPRRIVTPDLVRELYGVESAILTDPVHGTPVVCPVGLATSARTGGTGMLGPCSSST